MVVTPKPKRPTHPEPYTEVLIVIRNPDGSIEVPPPFRGCLSEAFKLVRGGQ